MSSSCARTAGSSSCGRARQTRRTMSWDGDDDGQPASNTTCSEFSTCSTCIDYFDPGGVGCLWCNVPKDASSPPSGGGLCLQRSIAQKSCEIGELQVMNVFHAARFRRTFRLLEDQHGFLFSSVSRVVCHASDLMVNVFLFRQLQQQQRENQQRSSRGAHARQVSAF